MFNPNLFVNPLNREKFDRAITQARIMLNEEGNKQEEQSLSREKATLQVLANNLAGWAKLKGMKKIAKCEIHSRASYKYLKITYRHKGVL